MRKILLLDKGDSSIHKFKKSLLNKGYSLINENKLKRALSRLKNDDIDLIVIYENFLSEVSNYNKFRKLTDGIPKIFLTRQQNIKSKNFWLKDRFAISVYEPISFREFNYWMGKVLKNKSLENENKLLRSELKEKEKELQLFNDITKDLNIITDFKKSFIPMMGKVKIMTGAEAWSLIINDEPLFETISLQASKQISKFIFKKGVGIAGRVLEEGLPLNIQNASKDRRYSGKADKYSNLKIKTLMCAPIKIKDRIVGILRLINKSKGGTFTDNDMRLLINAARYAAMIIERTFLYEKLKNDDLTNLFNIRYLNQAVEMEIERARRYNALFSLIFMDIDNFKKVNDRFGHLVGSRVLVELAQLLQKNLRKIDVVSRYGGDEFVIILPQTPRDASFLVAERLRKVIEKNIFLNKEGYSIRLTASFGIASYPDNAKSKEGLLALADHAMYRGKFSTKNIVFAAK